MKRLLAIIVLLSMVCLSFAGCGGKGNQIELTDGSVIKIGVFEPLTGENGEGGYQELLGIRYANSIYPTIEIDGKTYKIELVEADNKSDKTEAVKAAENLISSGAVVILGSYGSGVSIEAGKTFSGAKVPAIGASCTNPQVTDGNSYYFRVCFLDPFQGTVMANYAHQNGAKTAAIITQLDDDYSSGLGNYFETAFLKLSDSDSIVAKEQFETDQTDFMTILNNIKEKNPDVIFAPSSIATAPIIIKQAREIGLTCPIMAGDTWENTTIIDNAGSSAEGVIVSTFFDENATGTLASDFVSGFKDYLKANPDMLQKNNGEGIAAVSALGYDAYLVAIDAIKRAAEGKTALSSSDIKNALKNTEINGVTGSIKFDSKGDAIKDMAYIKMVENGVFKFVKTVSVAGN